MKFYCIGSIVLIGFELEDAVGLFFKHFGCYRLLAGHGVNTAIIRHNLAGCKISNIVSPRYKMFVQYLRRDPCKDSRN